MKKESEKILKKLKKGKISKEDVKIYLTSNGKIVAAGELALREREKKLVSRN